MDRLEQLVRDTLAEHAGAAPATLADRGRRRRSHRPRWAVWAPVAAAAAVIAIVAGLTVAQSHLDDARPAGPGPQQGIPSAPPVPAGYKLVSYHGIEFAVPATLQISHGASCGPLWPDSVTTLDPGMATGCTPGGNPKPRPGATYVLANPAGSRDAVPANRLATATTTAAGRPARIGYGPLPDYPGVTGVLILADPKLQLTVTAPTRAEVTTILRSVRLAPTDAVGCPSREPTLAGNAPAATLAPPGATAIALCGYAGFSPDHQSDYWLTGSSALPADRVKSTLAQLDALPAGSLTGTGALHDYVRLSYPDGRVRWLAIYLRHSNPDLAVTDGQRSMLAHENTGARVWKLLYPGSGWPEFNVSQLSSSGTGRHSPSPSGSAEPSATSTVPSGYKWVSYDGIEVAVPDDLPVTHSPCARPVNAVLAATNAIYNCPAQSSEYTPPPPPPDAISVCLGGGPGPQHSALSGQLIGHRTVNGVRVTVAASSQDQIDTILNSIRTVTVDHLGCPAGPASITPSGQPQTSELVPPGPTSAVVCEFSPIGTNHSYRLVGSRTFTASKLDQLVSTLDALPEHAVENTGVDLPQYAWIVFHYPDGSTRTIATPTSETPAFATDGNRTVEDAQSRVFGLLAAN